MSLENALTVSSRKPLQHRVEGRLDALDERRLVRESLVLVVHQHRGVDLEHHKILRTIEPAIDAEIVEADALPDFPQHLIMRGAEHTGGIVQERLLFPL